MENVVESGQKTLGWGGEFEVYVGRWPRSFPVAAARDS